MKREDKIKAKKFDDFTIVKNILGILFALAKSFFMAITQVAWAVSGIFLLNIALAYFLKEGIPFEISKNFLKLELFVIGNILSFVGIFFILYSYYEIKEVLK